MQLRVMTFNLRNSGANDGMNSWINRKETALGVVQGYDPDVLGIQEGLPDQVAYLDRSMRGYTRVGRGREADGTGEYSAMYIKSDRLSVMESGDFWLSDTPGVPGSITWGHHCVRMATWAVVATDTGRGMLVLNTHLDHESPSARLNGARLIRGFTASRGYGTIVMGDMNAEADSPEIRAFLDPDVSGPGLVDSLASPRPGTFHGFNETPFSSIDYILVTPGIEVIGSEVVVDTPGGVYPSDHYPVTAIVNA